MIDCFEKAFAMPCLLLEIYYHSIIKQLQCLVYIFTAASVNFMPKWLKIVPFSYKILIVYRTFTISKWGIFCEISYLYRHQKKLVLGLVDTTSSWWKSELVETHWNSYFLGKFYTIFIPKWPKSINFISKMKNHTNQAAVHIYLHPYNITKMIQCDRKLYIGLA